MSFEDLMDAFNSGDEVSCYKTMKVRDFIEFNPKESLKKGELATKVTMDKLLPFEKFISSMEQAPFSGGSKFKNGDTLLARITPCLENGKTAFVDGLKDGEVAFGSTEFIVLRCREGVSDPQYIYIIWQLVHFLEMLLSNRWLGLQGDNGSRLDVNFQRFPTLGSVSNFVSALNS